MMKKEIISKRYLNNGIPLVKLNDFQQKYLNLFLNDRRIKYKILYKCPLCESENNILIAEKDRYAIPLETVVCEKCGLVRNYKQLDNDSTNIFYSEYYRKIYEPFSNLSDKLLSERYETGAKRKIPKYATQDKTVLEIGCGGGWNLVSFHSKGYKYYGFDFDKNFIELGKKKGLNLYQGGVKEAIGMGIKCDYLLLDQVLEHTDNPIIFLEGLEDLLNEKAIINIYVPSLNLLWWGYSNYDLLGTLQNAHNFLFDEFTLENIALTAGFRITNCVAGNLVMQNVSDTRNLAYESIYQNRGEKIVKYLKFVEKSLCFRKKLGLERFHFKKFYCLLKLKGCYRKFRVDYSGKI
ncbi:MAG: class I SAM-dependent methyltransferase [bacterium]